MHPEEQHGFLPDAVKPHTRAGVSIAVPKGNQSNVGPAATAKDQIGRDKITLVADGNGAEWIGAAIFAGKRHVGAVPAGMRWKANGCYSRSDR